LAKAESQHGRTKLNTKPKAEKPNPQKMKEINLFKADSASFFVDLAAAIKTRNTV